MKIFSLLLALSFSCFCPVYSNQLHAEQKKPTQHLAELVAAIHMPPQFQAKFMYTHHNATEEVLLAGDIIVKGNKYRLTLEDQIIVSNGETLWNYIPSLQEVQICDDIEPDTAVNMETFSPIQLLQLYHHGFTPIKWHTSTIGQAPCYTIHFTPTKQQPHVKRLSLCLDDKTYQINRIKLTVNDQTVHQFDLMLLTMLENVKDQDFEFSIPPECREIIDLR